MAIRVDVSSQIGTGHFMRCLTLADALQQSGIRVRFICRHLPGDFQDMLAAKGHEYIPLNGSSSDEISADLAHGHWLGTSQHADAKDSIHALSDQVWNWLVVDHYALDARWESALRQVASNILVIDDIADRQHDCNVLLDQNFYADMDARYIGRVPAYCQLLLGPRYALLRDEFRQLRGQATPRTGPIKRVLVFFGGVDADNFTGRTVEALSNLGIEGLRIDVVIGAQHPCRKQIEYACVKHKFDIHVQTNRMAELIEAADLGVGAGGSTTWERCCLGLPTLTICVADNQSRQIADAALEGLLYAPELRGELIPAIKRHVRALMENGYLMHVISRNGMHAVDGRGVLRVIGSLGCGGIEIRAAVQGDSKKLFEWRNHPSIRTVSRNVGIIDLENHNKWFAAALSAPDRLLLIGQREGVPVGVVRFDIRDDEAEVSIYLAPAFQHSGQGRDLLQSAERWIADKRPGVCRVHAHVLGDNERSQRLFLGAGYQVESACYSKRLH
ncbi:MAG: UDP-2,4-diacetamido-2,4,6-trideoxy-beta-L-altropyranose hydrolase [Propionivibrio sp.]|nr:UDP-2,4-diacetamido-2,4,6-trideoxy-beta-L-altropyranose hydrolase [Propionivibrio sp.]